MRQNSKTFLSLLKTASLICVIAGCSKPEAQSTSDEVAKPVTKPVETAEASELDALDKENNLRLFFPSWQPMRKVSINHRLNQSNTLAQIKYDRFIEEHPGNVFFKNEGLMVEETKEIIPLENRSQQFKARIKMLDKYHFAFEVDGVWIIYRALDWEDEHYKAPW